MRESAIVQRLAGVEMLALPAAQLALVIAQALALAELYPGLVVLSADPIPLLWAQLQKQ
jgi:hypothetical protein